MITVEDIQKYLEVSPIYAQKLIDDANGEAYKTFIRKLNEKNSRPAVMEVMWWVL